MNMLLVGFDSAWTPNNSGALVGALRTEDGTHQELGVPQVADFYEGQKVLLEWQAQLKPKVTIVLLDQPTIVKNAAGQRPVENIVSSSVSLRYGGMQPANTAREKMFGQGAPIWEFLKRFGGAANPLTPLEGTQVFETYPVLAMIALGWTLPGPRPSGRLPKHNPQRRKTFLPSDWQHVCRQVSGAFRERNLLTLVQWVDKVTESHRPSKRDQDALDACICLLVALHLAELRDALMVGDMNTGYIVVPYGNELCAELAARCQRIGREPSDWVRPFRLSRKEHS